MRRWVLSLALLFSASLTEAAMAAGLDDAPSMQSLSRLRTSLVGDWRMEEASGTRYDQSKSGNHLTANNSPGTAAGKVGNCVTFVGGNLTYLAKANNSTLQCGSNFTYSAWVRFSNFSGSFFGIMGKWTTSGNQREALLYYDIAASRLAFAVSSNGTATATATANNFGAPSTFTWYFVTAWVDGTNANISINNGTPNTATVATSFASTAPFEIGRFDGGFYFNGDTDEVSIWKRVLTASERTYLYRSGLGTHFPWAHP